MKIIKGYTGKSQIYLPLMAKDVESRAVLVIDNMNINIADYMYANKVDSAVGRLHIVTTASQYLTQDKLNNLMIETLPRLPIIDGNSPVVYIISHTGVTDIDYLNRLESQLGIELYVTMQPPATEWDMEPIVYEA